MVLRKCPSCRETVGAESDVCPRCGVNFRAALVRRITIRVLAAALIVWAIYHYLAKML
jgi:hypothetical protein